MIRCPMSRSSVSVVIKLSAVLAFAFWSCPRLGVAQEVVSSSSVDVSQQVITVESLREKYQARGVENWDSHIKKLEEKNLADTSPDDSLLFFGSSSFRLWDSMSDDMWPYPSINRGYGGAKFVDMFLFAERMLKPHQYRALMLFAANDVKGEDADSLPAEVECAVREIIRVSKSHQPSAPIFIVEVTPTGKRFASWVATRKINATLREVALTTDNCFFIATADHYLDETSRPMLEYFIDDQLHLNEAGYDVWAGIIKAKLARFLSKAY